MGFVKFLQSQYFSWYFIFKYLTNCNILDPYYFLKEHDEVF